jgi:hypothetical protein
MTDVTYDRLVEFRNAAREEMVAHTDALKTLAEQLREGVSLKEANEIINRFWPTREANDLKVRMYSTFPKENGQIILNMGLDKRISDSISTDKTRQYFNGMGVYIQSEVQVILDNINARPLDCPDTARMLNVVKAQVSRYINFVNWGVYEIKAQLLASGPKKWVDLTTTVESVENGDYLFLENIPDLIGKAHDKFIEENFPTSYSVSLSDVDWRFGSLDAVMELSLLFAGYLHSFTDPD